MAKRIIDKTPTGWVGPGKMSYRVNSPTPVKRALKKRMKKNGS